MMQNSLVISLIVQHRKLVLDEAKQKKHRYEPYVNYLAPVPRVARKRSGHQVKTTSVDFVEALNGYYAIK